MNAPRMCSVKIKQQLWLGIPFIVSSTRAAREPTLTAVVLREMKAGQYLGLPFK